MEMMFFSSINWHHQWMYAFIFFIFLFFIFLLLMFSLLSKGILNRCMHLSRRKLLWSKMIKATSSSRIGSPSMHPVDWHVQIVQYCDELKNTSRTIVPVMEQRTTASLDLVFEHNNGGRQPLLTQAQHITRLPSHLHKTMDTKL